NAGPHNLTGKSNAFVATFYQGLFSSATAVDIEALTTALNVYATTLSLGGTAGQAYSFAVDASGLGAYSLNIGPFGAVFGVPDNTVMNVYELLVAANNAAVGGVLWNNQPAPRFWGLLVFYYVNEFGSVH